MIQFPVSAEKQRQLAERLAKLGISESDLEERFIRSSGSGGQHVNKTATCVQLTHKPTGIEVKCMKERSQSMNRFLARRELADKVAEAVGLATPRTEQRDRIRRSKARQKRRRTAKQEEAK
ncbi:MAG TPA: peptide chain release factor-like protein [Geobacteraceae bacterium]|nr:peptide chain release factor-like protein [Geobacteraceae bacterium]